MKRHLKDYSDDNIRTDRSKLQYMYTMFTLKLHFTVNIQVENNTVIFSYKINVFT